MIAQGGVQAGTTGVGKLLEHQRQFEVAIAPSVIGVLGLLERLQVSRQYFGVEQAQGFVGMAEFLVALEQLLLCPKQGGLAFGLALLLAGGDERSLIPGPTSHKQR